MANTLFTPYKESLLSLNPSVDLDTDTIKVAMVTAGYTLNAAHQFYSDITPGSNVVGTPQTLGSKTVTGGVFDAADATFTAVTGSQVVALVLYKDTGVNSTSPLIAYIDTGTGLPVTPNGGNITIAWDNGTNKIFKIG